MSAMVSGLRLSVALGHTVKYGDGLISDAKDKMRVGEELSVARAMRAAVGETDMSGQPPREGGGFASGAVAPPRG